MKLFLIPLGVLLLAGCTLQPPITAKFQANPATGAITWSNPKDTTLSGLEVGIDTNGTRYIKIANLSTLNNPNVVSAVGVAQANSITATGTAATQLLNGLNNGLGTVGGAAAVSALTK